MNSDHDDAIEPVPPANNELLGIASSGIQKASVSPSLEKFLSYGDGPSSDVRGEDLLTDGKAFHDEPDYAIKEGYLIGRPHPIFRFPIFDCMHYPSPMTEDVARASLEFVLADEQLQLPSLRSRLYRVSIQEVQ